VTKIVNSKYKACRRLGVSLWGSGKDAFNTRNYAPGQNGRGESRKISDYGLHLKAKQRLKAHYGRINERQFRNLFLFAQKMKGNTGENFIGLLESRLDAVVYRLNLASTIFAARQLVSHGHVYINGNKANIPSQRLQEGDIVTLKGTSKQLPVILTALSKKDKVVPSYLSFDEDSISGRFIRKPAVSDVPYSFEPCDG
jgi:small subunit ribosomal protein S4